MAQRRDRIGRGGTAAAALVLAAILFVTTNLFAHQALRGLRLDLTENGLYTLSDATREVLARIEEPVTLRLYYSERLGAAAPGLAVYAARVRELLEEYVEAADGRLVLEVYDPEPFSPEEDRAVAYGLAGVPLGDGGEPVYFGLAGTNTIDDEEVIPFLRPEREPELEYDLTRLIHSLATPDKAIIGLISTLPLSGTPMLPMMQPGGEPPFVIFTRLRELFDIRQLADPVTRIDPERIDVLMLVHPRGLSEATLYAIDQYVMAGGRAVVFADPVSEAEMIRRPPQAMFEPAASDLLPFAGSWGIVLEPARVVGDPAAAMLVNTASLGRAQTIDYLAWLRLGPANLDRGSRITRSLHQIVLATAGILRPREGAATTLEPLVVSGARAAPVDAGLVGLNADPRRLRAGFVPGDGPLVIAARVRGPAASAFPDGPPAEGDEDDGAERQAAHLAEAVVPIDLVVVADTDLLDDRFWVDVRSFGGESIATPFADNDALVINALEALTDAIDLSGLRGRAVTARPAAARATAALRAVTQRP